MERVKVILGFLILIFLTGHSVCSIAQDTILASYWYALRVVDGKVEKDSCLFKADYFDERGLPVKSEAFGPCHPLPGHITYMVSDSLLLGEIKDNGNSSSAYRYLYIEGVLAKKIANNHYPGLPAFISLTYDEQGRLIEEKNTDALGALFNEPAVIKYSYTKTGIHRVSTNAEGDVVLIEDILLDDHGKEKSISMRMSGSKHPFLLLKRY